MNNLELLARLERFVATNRFSDARKSALAELIGKQYLVSGVISRVSNTTGYLQQQNLRKGKTVLIRLDNSVHSLSIRCTRSYSMAFTDHDFSKPFTITVTITDYDEVRKLLQADQLEEIQSLSISNENPSPMTDGDRQTPTVASNHNDELLNEIQQMQSESLQRLSEAADDIKKAQVRNVPLVNPEPGNHLPAESIDSPHETHNESALEEHVPAKAESQASDMPAFDLAAPIDDSTEDDISSNCAEGDNSSVPAPVIPSSVPAEQPPQQPEVAKRSSATNESVGTKISESSSNKHRLDQLRRKILGDQQNPIGQKEFIQIIALETGVSIEKIKEIHRHLWHTVFSPSMFGGNRKSFNFFPFGDFRLMRNRDIVNMEFNSAPVTQLADHDAVEEYPHSNFTGSDSESDHPPIATQAIRIASTVAPLVGLSPPVTYDVIFETLQLLLKVFGVGKRRVRFTDIGEFFPVVLRGTLQYHFRPYRPLIRFATESFKAIISLAENEGEGQIAFRADKGVPDRTGANNGYSPPAERGDNKESMRLNFLLLILAVLAFWLLRNWIG